MRGRIDKSNFADTLNDAVLYDLMPPLSKKGIDYLFSNEWGISSNDIVADIGSGTGRLTLELLNRGCIVYAIEPDNNMKKICDKKCEQYDKYFSYLASAENTKLKDKSIDFVIASQSYHRFDTELFSKECNRILKDKKNVIIIWNVIDYSIPIFQELLQAFKSNFSIYESRFDNYDEVLGREIETKENAESAIEYFDRVCKEVSFENNICLTKNEFINLVLSLGLFPLSHKFSSPSEILNSEYLNVETFKEQIISLFDFYSKDDVIILPFITNFYHYDYEKGMK